MLRTTIGHYALAYLFWLITLAISLIVCVVILDTTAFTMTIAEVHRYPTQLVRQFLVIILGLIVLILLIWNEHYYRTGAERHRLLERFARIVGYLFVIMGLAHSIQIIAFSTVRGTPDLIQSGITILEWTVGVGGLWYAKQAQQKQSKAFRRK